MTETFYYRPGGNLCVLPSHADTIILPLMLIYNIQSNISQSSEILDISRAKVEKIIEHYLDVYP